MSLFLKRATSGGFYPPRIVCFVCAQEGPADYPLYVEASSAAPSSPHFPFLLQHPPPLGSLSVEATGGEAKACRPCYTTLMRQWDEYENARVPMVKRAYWIKRADSVPFLTPDQQLQAALTLQARIQHAVSPVVSTASHHLHHHHHQAAAVAAQRPAVTASPQSNLMVAPLPPSSAMDPSSKVPSSGVSSAPSAAHGWSSSRSRVSASRVTNSSIIEEHTSASAAGDNDSALDLSSGSRERETMKSRSSTSAASHVSAHSRGSYQSEGAGSSTDILDLTLPDKNADFEVCYCCGDEFKRGTLSYSFTKQLSKGSFYPSLVNHTRPPKSRPIDSSGRVQTCDECHNYLLQQWHKFEEDGLSHQDRKYVLRKRSAQPLDNTTFVCYICALEYQSASLRLMYARPNSEQEPYYPFIEQQKPPQGASPISPQGMVQVCNLCFKNTKEKHHGFMKADQPPPKKRRFEAAEFNQTVEEEEKTLPADVTCILCRRKFSVGSFKYLHSRGPPIGGLPYFPFLTDIPRPEELEEKDDDKQARVRACQTCTTSLMNQWTNYQRENVAIDDRQYTYPSLVTGPRSVSSVRAQSPASQRSGGAATPVKATSAPPSTLDIPPNAPRTRSNTLESRPHSVSNPHSPVPHNSASNSAVGAQHPPQIASPATTATSIATRGTSNAPPPPPCHSPSFSVHSATSAPHPEASSAPAATSATATTTTAATSTSTKGLLTSQQPSSTSKSGKSSSFYCFLCGLHSELSFSRMLYSSAQGKKAPYFPFMKHHVPKNKAETLREDGTALVCTFCYHSVMVQWAKYNESTAGKSIDPSQRKYNLNDYPCFVCGITTYRKRIRALRVVDFPFIRQHKARKGVISLENGEMVAVCLDCYDRLRGQFDDGERYGIPVSKREYNWMKIPPPPEEAAAHITTPQERMLKVETTQTTSVK